jgi:hypothetical protein
MKNEAGLRPMKRAFGTRKGTHALRFMRAKRVLHGGSAAASCFQRKRFIDKTMLYLHRHKFTGCGKFLHPVCSLLLYSAD